MRQFTFSDEDLKAIDHDRWDGEDGLLAEGGLGGRAGAGRQRGAHPLPRRNPARGIAPARLLERLRQGLSAWPAQETSLRGRGGGGRITGGACRLVVRRRAYDG